MYGTSARVLKTTARFRHHTNLRYTEGKGVRPGPFSIYSASIRNNGPFLKVAFWLNQLSGSALNCLSWTSLNLSGLCTLAFLLLFHVNTHILEIRTLYIRLSCPVFTTDVWLQCNYYWIHKCSCSPVSLSSTIQNPTLPSFLPFCATKASSLQSMLPLWDFSGECLLMFICAVALKWWHIKGSSRWGTGCWRGSIWSLHCVFFSHCIYSVASCPFDCGSRICSMLVGIAAAVVHPPGSRTRFILSYCLLHFYVLFLDPGMIYVSPNLFHILRQPSYIWSYI